ncbi:alkaline phosphatase D family protein [Marinicellulosiphila megalodicopiae]|uniref:alkaline phosphatase D family protein n=1 Tax=Marinicellulosiphila megalodicopiae TaxID=2724896 RepID=UPI003BAF1ED6
MSINNPPIGPILGMVTKTTARLMCGIQNHPTKKVTNCGWIRIRKLGNDIWQSGKRFRFNENFYYTGVIELTNLDSDSQYEYQMGYESSYSEGDNLLETDWSNVTIYSFNTQGACDIRFCFGSCLNDFGHDSRIGKVLNFTKAEHNKKPLNMMLWMGDQIYNDPAFALSRQFNHSKGSIKQKYYNFFNKDNVNQILPYVPNYMLMDDHEIEDVFTTGKKEYFNNGNKNDKNRVINGINAFYAYMQSHGPIFDTSKCNNQQDVSFVKGQNDYQSPAKHYTKLTLSEEVGVFLLDTRIERSKELFISKQQELELRDFLNSELKVKFVASSTTFLADRKGKLKNADNWRKAGKQRKRILDFITDENIHNVIFLSGDVHSHFSGWTQHNEGGPVIHQLISGALYWPLINPLARLFEKQVRFKKIKAADQYKFIKHPSTGPKDFYTGNAVGFVEIIDNILLFKIINHKGKAIISSEIHLV